MKDLPFEILPVDLLDEYLQKIPATFSQSFDQLEDSSLSTGTFSFYTSVSAVFSSKIEGENIELDSFMKHKMLGAHFLPDYTQKIDDLYEAYQFAQNEKLSYKAVQDAHQLLTKHILQKERQGQLRTGNMFVITPDGKLNM